MFSTKHISPTVRGQVTIPKSVREKLGIDQNTRLKIYVEKNKIAMEPVSMLDFLFQDIEKEAEAKDYTREKLNREINAAREKLIIELYK